MTPERVTQGTERLFVITVMRRKVCNQCMNYYETELFWNWIIVKLSYYWNFFFLPFVTFICTCLLYLPDWFFLHILFLLLDFTLFIFLYSFSLSLVCVIFFIFFFIIVIIFVLFIFSWISYHMWHIIITLSLLHFLYHYFIFLTFMKVSIRYSG